MEHSTLHSLHITLTKERENFSSHFSLSFSSPAPNPPSSRVLYIYLRCNQSRSLYAIHCNTSPKMNGDNRRRADRKDTRISKKQKLILSTEEKLETKLGFDLFTEGEKRLGWLLTFSTVSSYSSVFLKSFLN